MKKKKTTGKITLFVSAVIAVGMFAATIFTSGVLADEILNNPFDIKAYNGETELKLSNEPFIYDEQIYLPLRETLAGFGISDITWNDGTILINMLPTEPGITRSEQCEISLGDAGIRYTDTGYMTGNMYAAPIIKNDATYVTQYFFEDLIRMGQIPDYRLEIVRGLSPESYYDYGEEVFIGTLEEQDLYKPVDENGNIRYVKRIIVDENRNTIAVVTVENQTPDKLRAALELGRSGGMICSSGYSHMFNIRLMTRNVNGKAVENTSNIMVYSSIDGDTPIAYIPPAYQINIPPANLPPDLE